MIDWQRVDELRDEVGEEDFAEIAGLFLAELDETVAALPGIADRTGLSDALHGLKGSALNLGFADLAGLCATGEAAPEAAELPRIAETCAASVAELRTRFPGVV